MQIIQIVPTAVIVQLEHLFRHEIDTTDDKPGLLGLGKDSQTISSAVRRKKSALISVNSENCNAVVAVNCNSEENTTAEGVHGGKRNGAGRPKVNIAGRPKVNMEDPRSIYLLV